MEQTFKDCKNIEIKTITKFINQLKLNNVEVYEDQYSTVDLKFTKSPTNKLPGGLIGFVEVKSRNCHSSKYTSALMQIDKLSSVSDKVSEAKDVFENINTSIKGYYLMEFTDKTFLFDIEKISIDQIYFEKLPKVTANNSSTKEYVTKPTFYIPYSQAIYSY